MDDVLKRFESAVEDLNNFQDGGIYELEAYPELSEDLEICGVSIDGDGVVLVTPKHSIWGMAYDSHKFRFSVEDLAPAVVLALAEALEAEISARADWWES